MLGGLRLRQKIFAGYVLVGLIAVAIAVLAYVSFSYVSDKFGHFADAERQAELTMVLTRDVAELQRQVTIYTYEGHEGAADAVQALYRDMTRLIEANAGKRGVGVEAIKPHLDAYMDAFRQLHKQRQLQHRLVYTDIRASASSAESHLRAYIALLGSNNDQRLLRDEKMLNQLLSIEKNAMRYFDSLDQRDIKAAMENFKLVRTGMQFSLSRKGLSREERSDIQQANRDVAQYEQVFLEAVQRTRGYLYLVNVVMSAEAYEIYYHAKHIVGKTKQEMSDTESSMLSMIRQVGSVILFAILGSLLLVGLLSWLIGRSITRPIVSLTQAFTALAGGSHEAEIPLYRGEDEIGELTRAAVVFKEKNRQTEDLLIQARELTEELEANKDELERSNDELEQFVYTVSHDLKSPLVTSMGFLGIMQQLAKEGQAGEAMGKLDRVVAANERMGQLINDLLELSRVGRIDMDKKAIDLNVLLASFREMHAQQLQDAGFSLDIEPGLPVIQANESRMLQLFENLLSNALKYAANPEGSHISIGAREEGDAHLVWFRDNGPGIDPEYHDKIFGLFYRLHPETEGTGIGLAVAAKVMKFHNGSIRLESAPGQGATFWLRFDKQDMETEQ